MKISTLEGIVVLKGDTEVVDLSLFAGGFSCGVANKCVRASSITAERNVRGTEDKECVSSVDILTDGRLLYTQEHEDN